MYGSYGGLGSQRGYSNYGGYNSGYSGYSNSYNGLSSFGGSGQRAYQSQNRPNMENQSLTKTLGESLTKQNDPAILNQTAQPAQEQNGKKQVFEQWFKMMGGLRSILQLGFAALALSQFVTTSSQLLKKFFLFSKEKGGAAAKFVQSKLQSRLLQKLASPQSRGKYIKKMLVLLFRICAFAIIILGIRQLKEIKSEAKKKQAQLLEELRKKKANQVQLLSQSQIGQEIAPQSQSGEKTSIL